jgi:hypothetical protein
MSRLALLTVRGGTVSPREARRERRSAIDPAILDTRLTRFVALLLSLGA